MSHASFSIDILVVWVLFSSRLCMGFTPVDKSSINTVHDILRADRCIPDMCDLYDLYDLAPHVSGWKPYNLRDLRHASWVRSVPRQYM